MADITPLRIEEDEQRGKSINTPKVADIREEWSWVKTGVEKILEANKHLTYRPEDVYAACVGGQAVLWTTEEGFAVTTTEVDEFTNDKTLLIWIAWAKRKGGKLGIVHTDFFTELAKEHGYNKLEIRSNVETVGTYLTGSGWAIDTVVYSRDV